MTASPVVERLRRIAVDLRCWPATFMFHGTEKELRYAAADEVDAAKARIQRDASTLAAQEQQIVALREALEDLLEYDGGADNALEDPYVMERAQAALSAAREGGGGGNV